jgi:hypothetical protein
MAPLRPVLANVLLFASGCLLCLVWLDNAGAGQAPRQPARAAAAPRACGCDDKDAMQRDIDDSKWLAMRHRDKADELEKKENDLYRRMGRSLADGSDEMDALWNSYNSWEGGMGPNTAQGEFETARGYNGTVVVKFDVKTNQPNPQQLAAARAHAVCRSIADGISLHEKAHGDVRAAGGGKYSRPSQLAREEAAHYETEAKFVQDALDRLNCPQAQGSIPDNGERLAQRERVNRAAQRVAAFAGSLS